MRRYTITQFKNEYPNDDACLDKIFQLRFKNIVCKCGADKQFVRVKNRRSYQCPCCGFQIYPTKDTVFEKTTTPLTYWFHAIYLQTTTRNGVAAKELERQLNVCYKTALRMAHQIKKLMTRRDNNPFYGIVEIDETYLGSKLGNLKNKKRKEVDKIPFRDNMYGKTIIFGILQRGGAVYTQVIPAATKEIVEKIIKKRVIAPSKINTDNAQIYNHLGHDYIHDTVNHKQREWVWEESHVQNIESYWNQLKRTIKGTHIHVSLKHIQKYMDEVSFRWEHRDRQDEMMEIILSRVVYGSRHF